MCGRDAGVEVVLLAMRLMSRIRRYIDGLDALFLQLLQVSRLLLRLHPSVDGLFAGFLRVSRLLLRLHPSVDGLLAAFLQLLRVNQFSSGCVATLML